MDPTKMIAEQRRIQLTSIAEAWHVDADTTSAPALVETVTRRSGEFDELFALLYLVLIDLHPVYGNTSHGGTGIGGQSFTEACSLIHPTQPEATAAVAERAHRLLSRVAVGDGGRLSALIKTIREEAGLRD